MQIFKGQPRLSQRLADWFPDREFFMRSQGQVKFIKISARLQIRVFLAAVAALALWLIVTLAMLISQYTISSERMALVRKQAEVESSASRVAAYRDSVDEVAADLERRQQFIEDSFESLVGDAALEDAGDAAKPEASSDETDKTVRKISAIIPEARNLALVEARQLSFVDKMTRVADLRARRAEAAIRKFGLNPDVIAAQNQEAQGGPFLPFFGSKSKEDRLDPRFENLGKALARMDAMERGLIAIPSGKPAKFTPMTSNFGYRRDPFTGRAAMHSGIDFKGTRGEAILAAAQGKVIFAGRKSGYGNCIEIAHGNGLVTRYAHLSSIGIKNGQKVEKGQRLGGMGSTGRSTGTHLHFEVRLNGRAINPRPFLEANRDVLEIQAVAERRTDEPRG